MKKNFRAAFTLTEMLIVIGIIIMLALIAIPAFKTMTGSKSVEAASNQLSAFIGRARSEAIGLQQVTGVLFYIDPGTERVNGVMVYEVSIPGTATNLSYLDVTPNRDAIVLPPGILLETIDNCVTNSSGRRSDNGYIGFNPIAPGNTPITDQSLPGFFGGGVILFDGSGRLISKQFYFLLKDPVSNQPTGLGKLLYGSDTPSIPVNSATYQGNSVPTPPALMQAAFGFVLFNREDFVAQDFQLRDPLPDPASGSATANGNYDAAEVKKETWIDENSVPFFINRYNGTLIRGE